MNASSPKTLIVLASYHHRNTEKIAVVISKALDAVIRAPGRLVPTHFRPMTCWALALESTAPVIMRPYSDSPNDCPSRRKEGVYLLHVWSAYDRCDTGLCGKESFASQSTLEARGFTIVDESGCPGFNTNSFLKVFGGLNKGRPNADDLANARSLALGLK